MLFAVHISDGILTLPALVLGFVIAGAVLVPAAVRLREDDVPRIALMTAAFFVSSSIHVRVGPTSVHLILNALLGVVLGRQAPLAVAGGLVLQVVLLGHGGYTTLGVNTAVISVPALLAGPLFHTLAGRQPSPRRGAWAGVVTGWITVVFTAGINAAVLVFGGAEDWRIIASTLFVAYLILGVIEGLILGATTGFLIRARPDLLRLPAGETNSTER